MTGKIIRFGVITPQYVLWPTLVKRWQQVEALGFDSVWVADHWVNFTEPHTPWYEAWTLLAGLATHTTRIRIGPLISPIPFHNPAFLAKRAVTVDHMSGGRLELGLGTGLRGRRDPSYAMSGSEDWPRGERVARLREAVEIVDKLFRQEVVTYEGRYYRIQDAVLLPKPIQQPRPPLTIAARGPKMRKVAARYADTWNTVQSLYPFSDESYQELRQLNQSTDEFCERIGRDPASLRRSVLHFHPDPGMEFPFDSAATFQAIMETVIEIGFDEIILQYPYSEDEVPLFERVAVEVIPKLRT